MSTFSFFAFAVLASLSTLGADILPGAMERLPPGSVRPAGWLLRQMEMQRTGLTGRAEELYVDIGKSDWLTGGKRGGQFAWERGPYYAKGLTALAFTQLRMTFLPWTSSIQMTNDQPLTAND